MYAEHWGLADLPFRNTPDPKYFFFTDRHEEALARALYAVTEGQGAMLLTGDCGCGKTLVSRALVDELDPDRFEVALVPYPNLSPEAFVRELLRQFALDPEGRDKAALWRTLEDFCDAARARGATTLVIVDEAHLVRDDATLEEIRLLLNVQQDRRFGLTLLLMGQPELLPRLERTPAFLQRLTVRYHLGPMTPEESLAYLEHRLHVAGGHSGLFTREAETILVEAAGGVPRRLNRFADAALLAGFAKKASLVDADLARTALAHAEAPSAER